MNSKFVVTSKALISAFRHERFEIFDVFLVYDFEFALNELSVKNSTTSRKWCERLVWTRFFFFDDSFLFIRRFQIISSSFFDVQCDSFFSSTFRHRYRFSAFFISKELDLEKKNLFTKQRFLSNAKHIVEFLKRKLQFARHN